MLTGKCLVAWLIVYLCYIGPGGASKIENEVRAVGPQCSSCLKIQHKCTVSQSGLFCQTKSDKDKILFSTKTGNKLYNLPECVPPKYNVTGPILDWCCLWSPKVGCQQLAGTHYQNQSGWKENCDICLHSCVCDENRSGVVKCSPMAGWLAALGILVLLSRSYLRS
ncbi:uncharacterized protein LOC113564843 [Drosophila erecta]|uniref:GG11294 n=1 Tax=Drosophila erecta TaxID=7220 RepID=B3P730_DROER|nr:uncharacterized protein LOC6554783 [Drosophila erecta]XP_026839531.1 uncharacterized protein LOC113564843 [Drosophila erecta]EDV53850.1 uncharacterized protein Dere_GG11294 [Drosophila erecta]